MGSILTGGAPATSGNAGVAAGDYYEGSTPTIEINFVDELSVAVIPTSATYRIDDIETAAVIRGDTAITALAASIDLVLTAADTTLIDSSHASEDRVLTVSYVYTGGTGEWRQEFTVVKAAPVTTPASRTVTILSDGGAAIKSIFEKDPSDVLDYKFDWSDWLGDDDAIITSTLTVATGLTKNSDTRTDSAVIVWLSGGSVHKTYTVTNRIITSGGRTKDQSFRVKVEDH